MRKRTYKNKHPIILIHDLDNPGTYADASGKEYTQDEVNRLSRQVVILQLPAERFKTFVTPEDKIPNYKIK